MNPFTAMALRIIFIDPGIDPVVIQAEDLKKRLDGGFEAFKGPIAFVFLEKRNTNSGNVNRL